MKYAGKHVRPCAKVAKETGTANERASGGEGKRYRARNAVSAQRIVRGSVRIKYSSSDTLTLLISFFYSTHIK